MSTCYTQINPSTSNVKVNSKYYTNGQMGENLSGLFKKYASEYGLDKDGWKWLAALAWVETNWDSSKGLFQYEKRSIGKGLSLNSTEDQTKAAARDMKSAIDIASKYGLTGESGYLYAAISHNAGPAAAKWAIESASQKTINGMINSLQYSDGGYGQHAVKVKWLNLSASEQKKQTEIKAAYPIKVKSAYESIKKKYA